VFWTKQRCITSTIVECPSGDCPTVLFLQQSCCILSSLLHPSFTRRCPFSLLNPTSAIVVVEVAPSYSSCMDSKYSSSSSSSSGSGGREHEQQSYRPLKRLLFVITTAVLVTFAYSARPSAYSSTTAAAGITTKVAVGNDRFNRSRLVVNNTPEMLSSSPMDGKIHSVLARLTKTRTRYYMYEDKRFEPQPPLLRKGRVAQTRMRARYGGFALAEEQILEALKNHPLRTLNASEADLYIVPISLTRHMINSRIGGDPVAAVFDVLYEQEIFQSTQGGNRHVLITQTPNLFSHEHLRLYAHIGIAQHYPKLWNVTVVKPFDHEESSYAVREGLSTNNDFHLVMVRCGVPMSRSSASIGFLTQNEFPFRPASYEKFQNSSIGVFYHSRVQLSLFNSTPYRHALLSNSTEREVARALPTSSFGFDLPANEWLEKYTSSRFCMVIRGDNPTSRAHLRAVKVGCIPIVVSDMLPYYAPTLKSSISISDYSIFIKDASFLADPIGSLSTVLNNLTNLATREKIKGLALAQRLLMTDHSESLFVPALLHEVLVAIDRAASVPVQWPHKPVH
jgi:hypothetical protein